MQAKDASKQVGAAARSAALAPEKRSMIAAKAALKKAGHPRTCHTGNYRQCYGKRCRWPKTAFIFDTALILGTITTSLKQQ